MKEYSSIAAKGSFQSILQGVWSWGPIIPSKWNVNVHNHWIFLGILELEQVINIIAMSVLWFYGYGMIVQNIPRMQNWPAITILTTFFYQDVHKYIMVLRVVKMVCVVKMVLVVRVVTVVRTIRVIKVVSVVRLSGWSSWSGWSPCLGWSGW